MSLFNHQSDTKSTEIIAEHLALKGQEQALVVASHHIVNQHPISPIPSQLTVAFFAMGCFWGAERLFWQQRGVYSTSVGYSGGYTQNPTYQEVCSGQTGHAEVVRVVFDPTLTSYQQLLHLFWEQHDPAQGMRQGGDIGTQYRSAIYTVSQEQQQQALRSREQFQLAMLNARDSRVISTEIVPAQKFYFAEDAHQQYLAKNPQGYCGLGGLGICLPPEK